MKKLIKLIALLICAMALTFCACVGGGSPPSSDSTNEQSVCGTYRWESLTSLSTNEKIEAETWVRLQLAQDENYENQEIYSQMFEILRDSFIFTLFENKSFTFTFIDGGKAVFSGNWEKNSNEEIVLHSNSCSLYQINKETLKWNKVEDINTVNRLLQDFKMINITIKGTNAVSTIKNILIEFIKQ